MNIITQRLLIFVLGGLILIISFHLFEGDNFFVTALGGSIGMSLMTGVIYRSLNAFWRRNQA